MTSGPNDVDSGASRRQVRLAAAASVVGTSIEWYDYFLYGTAAAIVFPAVFSLVRSYSGTLESFTACAVGSPARASAGRAISGRWGDRLRPQGDARRSPC